MRQIKEAMNVLEPLRYNGAPIVTREELRKVDGNIKKFRAEWIARKRIFRE
jgi:hypothetical protein